MNRKQMRKRRATNAFIAMSKGQITPREADLMRRGWMRNHYGSLQIFGGLGWIYVRPIGNGRN